jgi:cell pole-organizing protein PopZ
MSFAKIIRISLSREPASPIQHARWSPRLEAETLSPLQSLRPPQPRFKHGSPFCSAGPSSAANARHESGDGTLAELRERVARERHRSEQLQSDCGAVRAQREKEHQELEARMAREVKNYKKRIEALGADRCFQFANNHATVSDECNAKIAQISILKEQLRDQIATTRRLREELLTIQQTCEQQ